MDDAVVGVDADFEVADEAVVEAVGPAVDGEWLAFVPGVFDDGGAADVVDLFDDVEFAEAVNALAFFLDGLDVVVVFVGDVLDVAEPVVDEAEFGFVECGADAAAAVVADDEDVFDFEDFDGVLEDAEAVEVGVDDEVGDVAVDEEFAWLEVDDFVGWDAAVGAADPEVFGVLL